MIKQYKNKILLNLKELKNLTYNKCYKYLKEYFINENKYFKKSDIINEGKVETLGNLCEIEKELNIHIWNEELDNINTINDLTLIVFHELISKRK